MAVYVIQEIGGNDNSPDSLNVMINYHCHGENRVITQQFPYMPVSRLSMLSLMLRILLLFLTSLLLHMFIDAGIKSIL